MSRVEEGLQVDSAVFGAGPVGCVAALALARPRDRVPLVEGNPQSAEHRLAGELLHPAGIRMLRDLGLDPLPLADHYPNGQGFVVFPEDGGPGTVLRYDEGQQGLSCDHARLVAFLRRAAADQPGVEYLPDTRVLGVEEGRLVCRRQGKPFEIRARRLIGATGRSPLIPRRAAGPGRLISGMAVLVLEDVEMPCEGFGHIFLGGPGPLLLYRIGERQV